MGHLHTQSFGELSTRVAHERDDPFAIDPLIFCPSVHYGRIVNAKNQDLVDPQFRKSLFLFLVTRDLARGSRGGESPGQAYQDDLLTLAPCGQGYVARVSEAMIDGHVWDWRLDKA